MSKSNKVSLNNVLLIGYLTQLKKLPEENTYKTRIITDHGNHRVFLPKEALEKTIPRFILNDFNRKLVGLRGRIVQTLLDEERIVVDQIVVLDSDESDIKTS